MDDVSPEPDETFTVVFEENSEDPQHRWTFTVTIKDNDPDRIPNVALDVDEHIVTTRTNFGRLVKVPEDPRQAFLRRPLVLDPEVWGEGALARQNAGRIYGIQLEGIPNYHPRDEYGIIYHQDGIIPYTISGNDFFFFQSISNIISRGSVPIPVELSTTTGRTVVSVDYATQDGTAKAGEDYTATSGTLTFQPGQTLRYLSIPILDDAINETNEFFNVVLSNPTNSVLVPRTVKVQILDNDEPAPDPPPVNVNNGGAVTPIITPFPSQIRGSASSSIMFRPTSLSLSESGSATYQVRATALPARDITTVNLATTHSGITLDPSSLLFTADNWQTYQTVTVSASSDAADINEQASIMHSIPASPGFVAINDAGIVSVTLAHTVVEEVEEEIEHKTVQEVKVDPTDYDQNDDGLIDISNLAQLNAIRWDLNGDGQPDKKEFANDYALAFPGAIENMGSPADVQVHGYELTGDLDFGDNPTSWESIGVFSKPFQAIFEGNEHTIYNLFQDQSEAAVFINKPSGLFGSIGHRGLVMNLGLEEVNIHGVNWVGALVGLHQGNILACSATSRVEGKNGVGGLVGQNFGDIVLSAADVEVNGVSGVGDLVGIDRFER